jgi:ElaB/YqjD/DUF883 family membrane-anchored ribosome-binding protein
LGAGVEFEALSGDHAVAGMAAPRRIEMAESSTETESRTERNLKSDIEAIRTDIDVLRKDLAVVLDRIKGTASSRAEAEVQALQRRINKIADEVQTSGREGVRKIEEHIEERPLVSLAMAFAVGLVLGRLFDRR